MYMYYINFYFYTTIYTLLTINSMYSSISSIEVELLLVYNI